MDAETMTKTDPAPAAQAVPTELPPEPQVQTIDDIPAWATWVLAKLDAQEQFIGYRMSPESSYECPIAWPIKVLPLDWTDSCIIDRLTYDAQSTWNTGHVSYFHPCHHWFKDQRKRMVGCEGCGIYSSPAQISLTKRQSNFQAKIHQCKSRWVQANPKNKAYEWIFPLKTYGKKKLVKHPWADRLIAEDDLYSRIDEYLLFIYDGSMGGFAKELRLNDLICRLAVKFNLYEFNQEAHPILVETNYKQNFIWIKKSDVDRVQAIMKFDLRTAEGAPFVLPDLCGTTA